MIFDVETLPATFWDWRWWPFSDCTDSTSWTRHLDIESVYFRAPECLHRWTCEPSLGYPASTLWPCQLSLNPTPHRLNHHSIIIQLTAFFSKMDQFRVTLSSGWTQNVNRWEPVRVDSTRKGQNCFQRERIDDEDLGIVSYAHQRSFVSTTDRIRLNVRVNVVEFHRFDALPVNQIPSTHFPEKSLKIRSNEIVSSTFSRGLIPVFRGADDALHFQRVFCRN